MLSAGPARFHPPCKVPAAGAASRVPHITAETPLPSLRHSPCQPAGKENCTNNPRNAHLRGSQVPPHTSIETVREGGEKENKTSKTHFPIDTPHICCATATQRIRHECLWLNERWKVLVKWITSSLFPMIDSFHVAAGDIIHGEKKNL